MFHQRSSRTHNHKVTRSLNPDDMADTLCGSPLYMAPEIIQNRKYDAKADLWSVGAILFQLVTGRPPFHGNSQLQLFQNILRSTELQFPDGALETLHPNCVDLCRSLLRQDPVERLAFQEFFNHNFLQEPRLIAHVEQSSLVPPTKLAAEQSNSAHDKSLQVHPEHLICSGLGNLKLEVPSITDKERQHGKQIMPQSQENIASDYKKKSISSMDQPQVADCLESIEKDYVLVYRHVTSTENISYYLATSLQENSNVRVSVCGPQAEKKNDNTLANAAPSKEVDAASARSMENPEVQESDPLKTSCNVSTSKELQSLSVLDPSTRLLLLRQYLQAVSEVVDEEYKAEKYQEAFSVELVVLAAWKKAVEICGSWVASTPGNDSPGSSDTTQRLDPQLVADITDIDEPSSANKWAEEGFISALNHGEKLSVHLKNLDGKAEMPDAMEIIFQKALSLGKNGAVDEYMGNMGNAAASYSKALLLFSFIVGEATSLALNPPFTLTPANRQRIHSYMRNLQTHQSKFSAESLPTLYSNTTTG
ncbi:Serine/threonine-protein kinase ATG1a [Linum grandiflorum]